MKYKQIDTRRKRNCNVGIKVTEQEQEDLKRICKQLGVTKLQFLLNIINEYKEM